jgi:hypothetical protein
MNVSIWLNERYPARYGRPKEIYLMDLNGAEELQDGPLDRYQVEGKEHEYSIAERELVSKG